MKRQSKLTTEFGDCCVNEHAFISANASITTASRCDCFPSTLWFHSKPLRWAVAAHLDMEVFKWSQVNRESRYAKWLPSISLYPALSQLSRQYIKSTGLCHLSVFCLINSERNSTPKWSGQCMKSTDTSHWLVFLSAKPFTKWYTKAIRPIHEVNRYTSLISSLSAEPFTKWYTEVIRPIHEVNRYTSLISSLSVEPSTKWYTEVIRSVPEVNWSLELARNLRWTDIKHDCNTQGTDVKQKEKQKSLSSRWLAIAWHCVGCHWFI